MELGKVYSYIDHVFNRGEFVHGTPRVMFPLIIGSNEVEYFNSPLHRYPFEHAVDIKCPKGTVILSPIFGKILDLRQRSETWVKYQRGAVDDPNRFLNWVTIQVYKKPFLGGKPQITPWIVQMCHIAAYSCDKIVGQFVAKGDILASVGTNGIMTTDANGNPDTHLHMVLGRGISTDDPFSNFRSYPLSFENA